MKAKCISNGGVKGLTIGRIYNIESIDGKPYIYKDFLNTEYLSITDEDCKALYMACRFQIIK